jgi:hypothetical protein
MCALSPPPRLPACRTLLDLDFDEAERIEQEIMQQGSLYSI